MKIAIGTTSDKKIQYLDEVLNEQKIIADILPFDAISGVSDQPISDDETKLGSINRAKHAMSNNDSADVSIGVEIGYHLNQNDRYEILCWATLVDKNGNVLSRKSNHFELPDFHQQILKNGKNLGDFVYEYVEKYDDVNAMDIATRKPYITEAIKLVLIEYYK